VITTTTTIPLTSTITQRRGAAPGCRRRRPGAATRASAPGGPATAVSGG
jgi:hypothetical protein